MIKKVILLFLLMWGLTSLYSPVDPGPAELIPLECMMNCVTPYGSILGINNGVYAYSNCSDKCSNFEDPGVVYPKSKTGFVKDVYSGVRWQCVEYARRWLIFNKFVSFASIDSAYQIFDLAIVDSLLEENSNFKFAGYLNGHEEAPQVGDLLIYRKSKSMPDGHVSVITVINIQMSYVEVCEQNYNILWNDQLSYARRLHMKKQDNNYFITNVNWTIQLNPDQIDLHKYIQKIIGWKRVLKDN